jgi:hypothetical protein
MLIDRESFSQGYYSQLKEAGIGDSIWNHTLGVFGQHGAGTELINKHTTAGTGGLRDKIWNSATDTAGKFMHESTNKAMAGGMDKTINQAGQQLGAGALNGAVDAGKQQLTDGWNGIKKTFSDYGNGLMNNPMQTIKDNPWLSGGLAAGGLGLGYMGGKMLGLWGDDNTPSNGQGNNNMPSNGQSIPPMMQSAYTQGYTPMALQKASSELPIPPPLAPMLSPSISVGSSIYNALNPQSPSEELTPKQVVVNPGDEKMQRLLKNPKMRAYVTNLINSTAV